MITETEGIGSLVLVRRTDGSSAILIDQGMALPAEWGTDWDRAARRAHELGLVLPDEPECSVNGTDYYELHPQGDA